MARSATVIILTVLCILLLLGSFFGITMQSAENMPAYKLLASFTDGKLDIATYRQGLLYRLNGMDYELLLLESTLQETLDGDKTQLLRRLPDGCRQFIKTPSLHNAKALIIQAEGLPQLLKAYPDVAQGLGLSDTGRVAMAFRFGKLAVIVAYAATVIWLCLCALFVLLGSIMKRTGFIVTALVMHTLLCLSFWSLAFAGLTLGLHLGILYGFKKAKTPCGSVDFPKNL